MKIIDEECIACSCFETCSTSVMKGSILCNSNRISAKQTKSDMYRKIQDLKSSDYELKAGFDDEL